MKLLPLEKLLIAFTIIFLITLGFFSFAPEDNQNDSIVSLPAKTVERYFININTATADELDTLDGIGTELARRIVDYRAEYGDFKVIHDLTKVSGIGDKTLDRIKEYIKT